jgi:hypothetical protein
MIDYEWKCEFTDLDGDIHDCDFEDPGSVKRLARFMRHHADPADRFDRPVESVFCLVRRDVSGHYDSDFTKYFYPNSEGVLVEYDDGSFPPKRYQKEYSNAVS